MHIKSVVETVYLFSQEDEKKILVEDDLFLDEQIVPQKMINIMIETLQIFIISYLKDNQRSFRSTKGFVRALKEILLRKFPHGVKHSHLLVSDPSSPNFFPWETIFDLSDFKDNEIVKDAKVMLKNTYEDLRSRDVTLKLLQTLMDENRINNRFQFLVEKVVKTNAKELKVSSFI